MSVCSKESFFSFPLVGFGLRGRRSPHVDVKLDVGRRNCSLKIHKSNVNVTSTSWSTCVRRPLVAKKNRILQKRRLLFSGFLASLKLPSYEEVAAQPSTPPPPYSSVFTTPRYPQPPRTADPHLLTQHDPLLHRPLSDGPSSLSSDNR